VNDFFKKNNMLKRIKKSIISYERILLFFISLIVALYIVSVFDNILNLKIGDSIELLSMIFFLPNIVLLSIVNESLVLGIVMNTIFYIFLLLFPIAGYFWTEKRKKNLRLHQVLVVMILLYIFIFIKIMTGILATVASV